MSLHSWGRNSKKRTVAVCVSILGVGAAMAVYFGMVIMGWDACQSFYFFAITISTVGFGTSSGLDSNPASLPSATRLFSSPGRG